MFLILLTLIAGHKAMRDTTFITVPGSGDTIWCDGVSFWSNNDTIFIDDVLKATNIVGTITGKADSATHADTAGWADLLDGYNEDYFLDTLFWTDGNVVFVPLAGDIQTYINAADSGSTLVLASGVYTLTDTLTIDKQLNIRGQGRSGFVTTPVTPSHGTLIASSTADMVAFQINSDNVRVADLSVNLTGAASTGVKVANNLQGIVFNNMDMIVNSTGDVKGFDVKGSDVVMRDLTFYITSSDASSAGVYFWNNNTTTRDAVVDAFNVTGTVVGAATYAYAFACFNVNDANTLTLNLSSSVCKSLSGTPLDIAVASTSTTTNNSVVNAYMCTFDGADYDGYQTGSNELNLGGSNMVNNLISGTVTYRATMVSDAMTTNYADVEDSLATPRAKIDTIVDYSTGEVTVNSIFKVINYIEFYNADSVTKLGYESGKNIVSGAVENTYVGYKAGYASDGSSTNAADYNVGIGAYTLYSNQSGGSNVALGRRSLYTNTTGTGNLGIGNSGLFNNTTGDGNVGIGHQSLRSNSTGSDNIGIGATALRQVTTGNQNVGIGYNAGYYQKDSTSSLTTPNNSIYIGANSKGYDNGDTNAIVIGYEAIGKGKNTVVIGNDNIDSTYLKGKVFVDIFKIKMAAFGRGYHLGGDSVVIDGDTFCCPNTGWTFIDTTNGDTLKVYLNGAWEAH